MSGKTLLAKKLRKSLLLFCFSAVFLQFGTGESLWDSQFEGYYSEKQSLDPGELFTVVIDSESGIEYEASRSGDKELVLQFTGGSGSDMFSFLPDMTSSRNEVTGGEETYSLRTELAVRVQEIDNNGNGFIQGSRTITLQGAVQSVTLSGWVSPSQISEDRRIPFDRITDLRLTYRSFLASERPVLTEDDIQEIIAQAEEEQPLGEQPLGEEPEEAQPAEEQPPEAQPEGGQPAEEQPIGTQSGQPAGETGGNYMLTDEKKRELLLLYMNSFLDLLFETGGN